MKRTSKSVILAGILASALSFGMVGSATAAPSGIIYNAHGYNQHGYNRHGYNRHGYNRHGYNQHGYNRHGYNRHGYNIHGAYNRHYNGSH